MADDRYRLSFERVATDYERARPPYVEAAVDWALERLGLRPGSRVLDLAAGTGKLTRQLVARDLDVVAVEPGDQMRAVLEHEFPEVEALAGSAEKIPLGEASVDGIAVGQAFHWFETEAAMAEMHRVLRPGGGFALFWNHFNQDDPLLGAVDEMLRAHDPARRSRWRERYDSERFGPLEEKAFYELRPMNADQLAAWVASTSRVISAPTEEQAEIDREVRRLAETHGEGVTIRTLVIAATRLS
ncbi:MAG TPA: class I SAM-dependent methyltransferase [Gaiellaceae bacterium]|nr:class I SAM-dependent methyltransferase [Gaiellaceae bacterium]